MPSTTPTALIGFDGYVDTLFRIKKGEKIGELYNQMVDFGNYVSAKNNQNFSLALHKITQKIGGNAPIFANALCNLGITVDLVASLGNPNIHPIFFDIQKKCSTYSYAEPGHAYAFEFDNGKMMLYENAELNEIDWQTIQLKINKKILLPLFDKNDFFCFLNWSEILGMDSIFEGILQDILPNIDASKSKMAFFDLADCSNRSKSEVLEVLKLVNKFSTYADVILSLNYNETKIIYHHLFYNTEIEFEVMGSKIFEKMDINLLVIHSPKHSFVFSKKAFFRSKTFYTEKPKISTGAGDHFNAGFCYAIMQKMPIETALPFANAVAYSYVSEGSSPDAETILNFLEKQNLPL